MLSGRPESVTVPLAVRRLSAGRPVVPVWLNQMGGITFEVGEGADRRFVKWSPSHNGVDLSREVERLRWAERFTAVPRVIDSGSDDAGSWFVTLPLPGENAVAERWKTAPHRAVQAIGKGLRALHERLPVAACPFEWSVETRVAEARSRAAVGLQNPADWHPEFRHLSLERALELLAAPPAIDHHVVCHGDACAPNTLVGNDGEWTGHVDLGSMGVADRWADLAIATWSTEWNYGPGWEDVLLDAYGIQPDPERTAYYRLLWDLGP